MEDSGEGEENEDGLISPAGSMASLRRRAAAEGVVMTGSHSIIIVRYWARGWGVWIGTGMYPFAGRYRIFGT